MRKHHLYLVIFFALIVCCKKESQKSPVILDFNPQQGSEGTLVKISGVRFDSVADHISVNFNGTSTTPWLVQGDSVIFAVAPAGTTTGKITVTVSGHSTTSAKDFVILSGQWNELKQLPVDRGRSLGVGFAIGNKGYIGMGGDQTTFYDDLYEYDPTTNDWTKKSSMGTPLITGVSFVINGKAYVGIGKSNSVDFTNSFYEYDPSFDKWTQKADFPGDERFSPVGLAIGDKGYVGLGGYGENDWWQYDPSLNSWTRKAHLSFTLTPHNSSGFTVNNKGYIVGTIPTGPTTFKVIVLEYNSSSDTWTQKNDCPSPPFFESISVATNDKGYLLGYNGNWIYDPANDSWEQKALSLPRSGGSGFSIDGKVYLGFGLDQAKLTSYNDFRVFVP